MMGNPAGGLVVIETHPIQYHAPIYRVLQQNLGIPVTAIYGSDFSVAGYRDPEFGETFAWDTDLMTGYTSLFLSRTSRGEARSAEEVAAWGVRKVLQKVTPRAVLLVGYSPCFHQMAFYEAWMAGCPILFRGETTDHALKRSTLKSWLRDRTLRWFYQRCAKLLYVGRRSHQHFQRLGCPDERLLSSPYCVDTDPFELDEPDRVRLRSATRQRLGITDTQTVLLFSGKLSRRKGPDLLLQAVKGLPPEIRQDVFVFFLGSGRLMEALRDLAGSAPSVKTHFLGFQNQTHLSQYYHAADLLVLPSRYSETWGLVINEALHHGLPCVASNAVGCTLDLIDVGVTGEVFETGSLQGLISALQRALVLKGRPEIRQKCREKVGNYTVEKAADGIASAYWAVEGQANPVARCS